MTAFVIKFRTFEREACRYYELAATLPGLHAEADRLQLVAADAVAKSREAWGARGGKE